MSVNPPVFKRSIATEDDANKRRRGPKSKDEKDRLAQKSADYWLMRPISEFLQYRRELLWDKLNYHKQEYLKFKTAIDKLDADMKLLDEGDEEEEEEELEVEVEEEEEEGEEESKE